MVEYKYIKEEGYLTECESCGSVAPLANFPLGFPESKDRLLCELCSSSFIGNATRYREQYENVSLYQVIAQVGNVILDKLTNRKEKEDEE